MAHFAKVERGVVVDIIVADESFIATLPNPEKWLLTDARSIANVHYGPDGLPDNLPAFRKNYATVGGTYDATLDAFIPPKPYPSWVLNTDTYQWDSPTPYPNDGGEYVWDEQNKLWAAYVRE